MIGLRSIIVTLHPRLAIIKLSVAKPAVVSMTLGDEFGFMPIALASGCFFPPPNLNL